MRNVIGVAIKHERLSLEEFSDATFTSLAPSRMIHFWVHVGIKTIFVGCSFLPSSRGLLLDKTDSDDGCAVLFWELFNNLLYLFIHELREKKVFRASLVSIFTLLHHVLMNLINFLPIHPFCLPSLLPIPVDTKVS